MRALYFDGELRLRDLPEPRPGPGEALVRVHLAGVCRTDLEVLKGYHGFTGVPGHEFVGEVAEAPDPAWGGWRVVGEINVSCGHCRHCRTGLTRHCAARRVLGLRGLDGTWAEYMVLPAANLLPVPGEVPEEAAVFAEPLAAALAAAEAAPPVAGGRALVIGDGVVGLLTSWVLALTGAEVHLAGHYREHLGLGESYGVQGFLEGELPAGEYDLVVEASGSPGGLTLALARVRPRGTVVVKSTFQGEVALPPARLVVPEVRLVGSRCGPLAGALRVLARGRIDPRPLIKAVVPLSEGPAGPEQARQPGSLRVLVDCHR
jgi:threonine dehydrogenase-like Zn-dependent dehydrogenase